MKVVLAYAHPCPDSFVAAVCDRVVDGLAAGGHHVHVIDLYADGYDPLRPFRPADRVELDTADALVLVHPTWWTSQPAILLAWIAEAVETGLPSVRSLASVTTHGGSRLANRLAGESGARVVSRAVRARCSGRPRHRRLALYGLDRSTLETRTRFLDRVERRIAGLVE